MKTFILSAVQSALLVLTGVMISSADASSITVTANPIWTDTGIFLSPSDGVRIHDAIGNWTFGAGYVGPDGWPDSPPAWVSDDWITDDRAGQLIGAVMPLGLDMNVSEAVPQNAPELFQVGTASVTVSGEEGELWLGINDAWTNGNSDNFGTLSVQVDAVPEPSTFTLLGIGVISLVAYAWRRRPKTSHIRRSVLFTTSVNFVVLVSLAQANPITYTLWTSLPFRSPLLPELPGTWDLSATLTTDGLTGEVLSSSDIVSGSLTLSGPYGTFTEAISNISGLTADSTGLWAINTQPWPAYIATPDMVVFWSSTSYYDVPPSYSGRVSPPLTASQVGFGTVSPDWPVQDGEGIWLVATVSEVPEPASIMLLVTALLGLVGFTFVRRRRRAKGYRQLNWMGLSVALIVLASGTAVRADTITHGGTTVNMDFVSVGNAGNPADTTGFGAVGYDYRIGTYDDRGREGRLGSRPPLPPNRTGGSPASGSPVSGFTSKRIDGPRPGRGQAPLSASAGIVDPDLRGKAINMTHRRRDQSVPGHVCLMQSVVLSRCRHLRYGGCLVARHVTSTFLRSFARRALPRFVARMNALTPERPALRILIRDNERRACLRSGLLASCIKPSDRSASNHLLSPLGTWFGFVPELTARPSGRIPFGDHSVTWASPLR